MKLTLFFYSWIQCIIVISSTLVFISKDRRFWETSNGHAYFILPHQGVYAVAKHECSKALEGAYPAVFDDRQEWEDTKSILDQNGPSLFGHAVGGSGIIGPLVHLNEGSSYLPNDAGIFAVVVTNYNAEVSGPVHGETYLFSIIRSSDYLLEPLCEVTQERSIQAVPLENFVTDSDVNTCSSSETRQQTFIMYRKFTTFDHFIANVTLNTMKTTCDRVGYDFVYKDEQYLAGDCSQARMCTVAGEYSLKDRLTCAVKCPCKTQRCHFILHRSTAASLINLCEVNVSF